VIRKDEEESRSSVAMWGLEATEACGGGGPASAAAPSGGSRRRT
jgi:hypothetical protein